MITETAINVLVVEDEPVIMNNIVRKIESVPGFKASYRCFNGISALRLLEEAVPDAIMTDIRMPGMDGLTFIRQAKEKYPGTPVIILSGFGDFQYAQQAIHYGVQAFLLKPLDLSALAPVLDNIRADIQAKRQLGNQRTIQSILHGKELATSELEISPNSAHIPMLIAIGNLSNPITALANSRLYSELWNRIDWQKTMSGCGGMFSQWWAVDESAPNRKMLIGSLSSELQRSPDTIRRAVERIFAEIRAAVSPYCANLIVNIEPQFPGTLWQAAHGLRSRMEHHLAPCRSVLREAGAEDEALSYANLLDLAAERQLREGLESRDLPRVRRTVQALFGSWQEGKHAQKNIENALQQLLKIFQTQSISISNAELYSLSMECDRIVALATDADEMYRELWRHLERLAGYDSRTLHSSAELVDSIEEYLRKNYAANIDLRSLAQKFHFTPAYLTKLFKKNRKEAPLNYVTTLRIEKAKQLIADQPDLSFGEIADQVGYADAHYFSRIFKSKTGMSPTEYRKLAETEREAGLEQPGGG